VNRNQRPEAGKNSDPLPVKHVATVENILMRRNWKVLLGVLFGASLVLSIGLGTLHELSAHIPSAGDVSPWRPSDASQYLEENDLADHMPDMATIYSEYGFKRAAYQSYSDAAGRTLRLELYEMMGSDGAYGLFTFKRRGDCELVDLGDEACLSDQHLHVWRERFVITVLGSESGPVTREDLLIVGRATCDTITGTGTRPDIVTLLPPDGLDETSIHYLTGSRALPAAYNFGFLDTFHVMEGVGGRIGESTGFFFRYTSAEEAERIFPNVIARLSGPDLYRLLGLGYEYHKSKDTTRPKFVLATESSFILMTAGNDISTLSTLIDVMRGRVNHFESPNQDSAAR
jgi:hypothetical protein